MSMEIKLVGLDEVLKRLDEKKIKDAAEAGMAKGLLYVHKNLPPAPPPPPNSNYTRTGKMLGSITTKTLRSGGDIHGIIGPHREYAPFVIGHEDQAPVHRGRWWTLYDVVSKQVDAVVDFIRAEVAKVW